MITETNPLEMRLRWGLVPSWVDDIKIGYKEEANRSIALVLEEVAG